MSKVLKANRSFISIRSGFKRLGDVVSSSDPEYARLLRFALKQKSEGNPDPIWVVVDESEEAPKEEAPKEETPKEETPKEENTEANNSESAPAPKKTKDSK